MQYELLYLIPATLTDEEVSGVENAVGALFVKHGATAESTTRLGKLRLAYPIGQTKYGHYVLARLSAEPSAVAPLDAALRITSGVLRHLILRADEAGGEKFDLIPFTEVNLDTKDTRDDRRRMDAKKTDKAKTDELKSAVAVLEGEKKDEAPVAAKPELSAEELQKKIDAALEDAA